MIESQIFNEIARNCLVTSVRRISRVLTGIYDEALRPFGITSPQFTLLLVIVRLGSANRAEIGRYNHQDRSTLSRNLQLILAEGWAEESTHVVNGRSRPLIATNAGKDLLCQAAPAWRAAQSKAKAILGERATAALIDIDRHLPKQGT